MKKPTTAIAAAALSATALTAIAPSDALAGGVLRLDEVAVGELDPMGLELLSKAAGHLSAFGFLPAERQETGVA